MLSLFPGDVPVMFPSRPINESIEFRLINLPTRPENFSKRFYMDATENGEIFLDQVFHIPRRGHAKPPGVLRQFAELPSAKPPDVNV